MLAPNTTTFDYRWAVSHEGPLAGQWADKPHRLVYDLVGEVERLNEFLEEMIRQRDDVVNKEITTRALLEILEWGGREQIGLRFCRICRQSEDKGHRSDCLVKAALGG